MPVDLQHLHTFLTSVNIADLLYQSSLLQAEEYQFFCWFHTSHHHCQPFVCISSISIASSRDGTSKTAVDRDSYRGSDVKSHTYILSFPRCHVKFHLLGWTTENLKIWSFCLSVSIGYHFQDHLWGLFLLFLLFEVVFIRGSDSLF